MPVTQKFEVVDEESIQKEFDISTSTNSLTVTYRHHTCTVTLYPSGIKIAKSTSKLRQLYEDGVFKEADEEEHTE